MPLIEQVLHAAQIAQSFLAHRADERDGPRRLDLGLVHRANHREQYGEAAAIIANAGATQQRCLHV